MTQKRDKKRQTRMTEEEIERSEEAARILRGRRVAATGPKPIDDATHRSLLITRAALVSLGLALCAYFVSRLGIYWENTLMVNVSGIAIMVLFPLGCVLWFVSRHQAKKLTAKARAAADEKAGGQSSSHGAREA